MKRFCALFACAFLIIAKTITYVPVKAVGTTVDFGEMLNEYLNVAEMGLALSQGATIDWSDLEIPVELDTDQEKARYIINYIGALRHVGTRAILDIIFEGQGNPYLDNVAAIGLSTSSGIGAEGTQDIRSQLADVLALNNGKHIFQRYNDAIIARWNNYNTNYINDYLDTVNIIPESPTPPSPDADFVDIIDYINNRGFTIKDYNQFAEDSTYNHYKDYPLTLFTWTSDDDFSYWNCNTLLSIYITGSDTSYTFATVTSPYGEIHWSGNDWRNRGYIQRSAYVNNNRYYLGGSSNVSVKTYTYTGTLNQIFNYIKSHFRNVNIYVNGTPWALPGFVIDNPSVTVSIPDAVIDSGTDDGKIVAHPIYYPDTVKNGGSVSIDLDTLNDIIAQKVADGATSISMDDVIDAGAVIDADGTTLNDADTDVADVSIPIAKAGAIDTTITPTFPNLNIIPPLPILPDINTGDANSGFQGMSVLARIINVTVQSCPEPLIMTFFGVVFGVVILGIIKILHH